MANRLSSETSPYLLQHADNPVDWFPWGPEAFAEAQRRNVPILLSVGYSACHWCHVMAHESFENPAIAARMNTLFVNVKVDREERPDIDELYMRAVQAFNRGQGGWPMTVFLTPDGRPFFGGTYFPPVARSGMPGFVDVLVHVAQTWAQHRGEVDRITSEVVEVLDRSGALPAAARTLTRQWLEPVAQDAIDEADALNGGWGTAPKFPAHGTLANLVAHVAITGEERARDTLVHALDAMAKGAMYDLLGGGFCRYSVDAEWRVPHFEKMLYDNAQLVPVYADAWKLTGDPHYARVVRETVGWMLRELRLPHGGLASALDADSPGYDDRPGGEGAYYAWTPDQLRAVLGDDAARVATLLEVTDEGTFEHGASVLRLETPLERLPPTDRELLERSLPKLFAAREARPRPARDDKMLVAWNGLAVSALARAGDALDEPDWVAAAIAAVDVIEQACTVGGRLMRSYRDQRATVPAFADDHANLLQAYLDLWEATWDPRWLDAAQALADRIVALFWDDEDGGLFLVGADQPQLVARSKHPIGGAEPSANGTAALAFVRLAKLTGRSDLQDKADRVCRAAQTWLRQAPRALGAEVLAGAWLASGGLEVAFAGDPSSADTIALVDEVRQRALPFTVTAPAGAPLPWLDGKTALGGRATAYVCEGWSCRLPVQDPAELGAQLDEVSTEAQVVAPPTEARVRAPELPDAPEAWIGTDVPLTLERLKGHVVVLDFWTYCCINCMHVLPELRAIEERFADQPVAVIGVHCAKFPAEEVADNVRRAMQRHGVRHPVVHDPVHAIWEAYTVKSWPTIVVVDTEGRIALQQPGEIGREELATVIEGLLDEGRRNGTIAPKVPIPVPASDPGGALRFPGKVHVYPDAFDQEVGNDPLDMGFLYVTDTGHHRILECQLERGPDGWPRATLLRTFGSGEPGLVDGDAATARFHGPQGVRRIDDVLYVADTDNHALRRVDLATGAVETLAGTGRRGTGTPSRDALRDPPSLDLRSPWDVEVMQFRNYHLVFVAMAGSHQIWVYERGVGHIGIHTGSGREDHVDGPSASAALAQPSALALLGRYLLFADSETSSIRAVDLQAHQVVTVVGRGLFDFGDVDGRGDAVRLQHPLGVTFAGEQVFVADTFNHKIKAVGLSSGETRTVVGGDPAVLREPGGIARCGRFLIVADTNNHRVRSVNPMTGEIRDLAIRQVT